jgi:hypothetical protein
MLQHGMELVELNRAPDTLVVSLLVNYNALLLRHACHQVWSLMSKTPSPCFPRGAPVHSAPSFLIVAASRQGLTVVAGSGPKLDR